MFYISTSNTVVFFLFSVQSKFAFARRVSSGMPEVSETEYVEAPKIVPKTKKICEPFLGLENNTVSFWIQFSGAPKLFLNERFQEP
jgi:hypothetical protein